MARETSVEFEAEVRMSADRLRGALVGLFEQVGVDPRYPQEAARHLGLDKTLSWKVCRLTTEGDAVSAIPKLPGKPGLKMLVDAFERGGAPEPAREALWSAVEEFEAVIQRHAGDRATLEVMLSALNGQDEDRAEREVQYRRMSFLGNCATWGIRARAQHSSHFLIPAGERGMLDMITVTGLHELRRLREDASWSIVSLRNWSDQGHELPEGERTKLVHPLDPSVTSGPPVLREFSSDPLPPLSVDRSRGNEVRYEIGEGPVGLRAAATAVFGYARRASVSRFREAGDEFGETGVRWSTPVESAMLQVFLHRDLRFGPAEGGVFSEMPAGPVFPGGDRARARLSMGADVETLESPERFECRDVPRMREMVGLVCDRTGIAPKDLVGYRLAVAFPPIPSMATIRFLLEER